MSTTDWQALKTEYEQGIPQSSLARKYGISQQAISKRVLKEGWAIQRVVPPTTFDNPSQPERTDESDPHVMVRKALRSLAKYLKDIDQNNLELKEHKLFADAFSQYIKVHLLLPSDKPTESGLPADLMPYFDIGDLGRLNELHQETETIIEAARARKLEAEGIKSIRKIG